MQDVRLRTGVAVLLSVAAFLSLAGAAAAGGLVPGCLPGIYRCADMPGCSCRLGVLVGFFAIVLQMSGGDGVSYFIRMMVIVLIGAWVYSEQKKGEFLRLGVWLLGEKSRV